MLYEGFVDFATHNRESAALWQAFQKGEAPRVPMTIGLASRFYLFDRAINPRNISYKEYTEDRDVMFEMQVRFDHYKRFNIPFDQEMGPPSENGGWSVMIDLQNYYEAVWFGADLHYFEGNVPDSLPFLKDDNKRMLFNRGIPATFNAPGAKARDYYEYFKEKSKTFVFEGHKVANVSIPYMGTDGPFTVACNLRGATEICLDIFEDPAYVHELMSYITDATIARVKDLRAYYGRPPMPSSYGFADDSIQLLSAEMYREFVLPYHSRLVHALCDYSGRNSIHLCGDATRHFRMLKDELNICSFDTGYPIDFGKVVREMGPEVTIMGGPKVDLLLGGTAAQVVSECKRILDEVMPATRRFALREANNLAPFTPLDNISAMYGFCRDYGRFER